jgi:hypothetical protein
LLLLHHRVHHLRSLLLHPHAICIEVEWLLLLLLLLHLTHEGVAWLLAIRHHHHVGAVGLLLLLLLRVVIGHHVRVLDAGRHEGVRLLILSLPHGALHVVASLHHGWLLLLLVQGRRNDLNWLLSHVGVECLERVELGLLHEATLS